MKHLKDEGGVTLVEVVTSLVLITIILLSFAGLFIQSTKTGKASQEIVDATYIAQVEMENMYSFSKFLPQSQIEQYFIDEGYTKVDEESDSTKITFTISDANTHSLKKFKFKFSYNKLLGVVVEVYDPKTLVLKSKMENILEWKEG